MTVAELMARLGFSVNQSQFNQAQDSVNKLGSVAKKALGAIGIAFSLSALNSFKNQCIQLGSDAEQMQEKFNTVFQGMEDEANEWAESYAASIGRSSTKIKTYISDQQNLLVGFFGTDKRKEAMAMSEQMTSLALDLASFANTDEDTAVNAMTKAVMGESEAAKTLGAVLNDTTRLQAMETLGLQGKYDALDQATKMQVNYQAILAQSPDAIGDCVRSMDTYESRQRQLTAAQQDYKTYIGMQLLPIQKMFVEYKLKAIKAVSELTKKILGENEQDNKLLQLMNKLNPVFKTAEKIVKAVASGLGWLADRFGGVENVIKIVITYLGAFVAYLAVGKIIAFIAAVKKFTAAFTLASLKVYAIVAVIALVLLVIEDFVAFMQGKDSVIGEVFEAMGLDADAMREKIQNVFDQVGGFISDLVQKIGGFISENGEVIAAVGGFIAIMGAAMAVGSAIAGVISFLSGVFTAIGTVIPVVGAVLGGLSAPVLAVIAAVGALIAIGVALYENWDAVVAYGTEIWNGIVDTFNSVVDGVGTAIGNVYTTIVDGIQAAIDWITALPGQAIQWGSDMINGFINGIKGAIGGVADAAKGVAEKITSFIHFSRPDEGPLRDYETWMPDMINGMAAGIKDNKEKLYSAVKDMAGGMSVLMNASVASPQAVRTNSVSSSRSTSVVQNNSFSNSYTGTSGDSSQIRKAMNYSAVDASTELARALAISRG